MELIAYIKQKCRDISLLVLMCIPAFSVSCSYLSSSVSETAQLVDSLNERAYYYCFINPDSALRYADTALERAGEDVDGKVEALNHRMAVEVIRMNLGECNRLYQDIIHTTRNEVELLVSEVNMMQICLQAAKNRKYYDFRNRALHRIRRLNEKGSELTGRDKERMERALVAFRLTVADYLIRMMQPDKARKVLSETDLNGFIREDKALLTRFFLLNAMVEIADLKQDDRAQVLKVFDGLLSARSLANRYGLVYYEAWAALGFADFFMNPKHYEVISGERHVELDLLARHCTRESFVGMQSDSISLALATYFSTLAFSSAERYDCFPLKVNTWRVQSDLDFERGQYDDALSALDTALVYLDRHHRAYSFPVLDDSLRSYEPQSSGTPLDILWTEEDCGVTMPHTLTGIRERLSMVYSAMDEKQKSDYNRNLYLDLLDFTRQDKLYESRVERVEKDNRLLNILFCVGILLVFVLCVFLYVYARAWKKREARQYLLLENLSDWFSLAILEGHGLPDETMFGSQTKEEKRTLHEVKSLYADWVKKNQSFFGDMDEEKSRLYEELQQSNRQIVQDKKENITKRAKVSLVHAVMPFIDRILYMVRQMKEKKTAGSEMLVYVDELSDEIVRCNHVLGEWIRMNHGTMDLCVESFPLQGLFDLLDKGGYAFERKNIQYQVKKTELWVKADRALTFFMLNTLADNARKFTLEGGLVIIEATSVNDAVEISVSDTGCGLSAEDVTLITSSKIYDAERIGGDNPIERREKGYGFGLLNCKGIIEKYKKTDRIFDVCTFNVESEKGKGSRFSFRLPKGMIRKSFVVCLMSCMFGSLWAQDDNMNSAVDYADSVYFNNVDGRYERSLQFADSALRCLNRYYGKEIEANVHIRPLSVMGDGGEELDWYAAGVEADYHLIMGIRNEMAVATLATCKWDVYAFNNEKFIRMYRLLTHDDSLEGLYEEQRKIQSGLTVSIALLVVLFLFFCASVYMLFFRRKFLFRFHVMQVLEINQALLRIVEESSPANQTEDLLERMLNELFLGLRELHELECVRMVFRNEKEDAPKSYEKGEDGYGRMALSIIEQVVKQGNTVYDEELNMQVYPMFVRSGKNERDCYGAISISYGSYRMQKEDFLLESYVINYISILIYACVVQRGLIKEYVESVESATLRALYEKARLRVQNQILDNCLSTIKHESMYYPTRIKQIVRLMKEGTDLSTQIDSLCEVTEYYKEIYTLLCAQADRQIDTGYFKREKILPNEMAHEWMKHVERYARKKSRTCIPVIRAKEDVSEISCDGTLLSFLLETITEEWLQRLWNENRPAQIRLEYEEENAFVRFVLSADIKVNEEDCFTPGAGHYPYLLCKEIIREFDKLNNFCGCRICVESDSGCRLWFTVPKYIKEDETF